ncbi:DUF4157 domain-containing protein [Actinophytocola xinjiangensis]|uniref:eCIS core domain-containing protein n=1 Tax=Actinophytocola xinjiangensis TaxID=485602 RepID=UPI000A07115E|nr:DUF4157 domain-containing protein [Actinophytocola xinjiangensis]
MHAEDQARAAGARKGKAPAHQPQPAPRTPLLALQRGIGNAAVVQLLRRAGHPGAQERHRHGPDGNHQQTALPVQRSAVHDVLRAGGRPLDDDTRTEMEARLGADFSDVRIHTDSTARASAAEIGARAYTSGDHVVIGDGGADKHTLAHELTHVIQQRSGPVAGTDHGDGLTISDPHDRFERAAEANARQVISGVRPSIPGTTAIDQREPSGRADEESVQRYVVVQPGGAGYPTLGSRDEEGQEREPGEDFFPSQHAVGGRYVSESGEPNIQYNGAVPLRISAKSDLAIEDVQNQAKAFFATEKRIAEAEKYLKGIVQIQQAESGNYLTLRRTRKVLKIKNRAEELTLWQVEPVVIRQPASYSTETEPTVQRGIDVRLAQRCNEIAYEVTHRIGPTMLPTVGEERYFAAVIKILGELTDTKASQRQTNLKRIREAAIGKVPKPVEQQAYTNHLADLLQEAIQLRQTAPDRFLAAARKFDLNEFIPPPAVGDVLMIKALRGDATSGGLDFHFAGVVARSGNDYITMENFARHESEETLSAGDPQWYFQMYGTEQDTQTWHKQWGWEDRFQDRLVLSILLGD